MFENERRTAKVNIRALISDDERAARRTSCPGYAAANPRAFIADTPAFTLCSVYRACSGHNIIPTTHRRNEPFIAALLGCCFLSQANTTSSCLPPPPPAAFSPLLFRASLFLLSAAHHSMHTTYIIYIYVYITCVILRYVALHCVYAPRWCTRVAPLHLRTRSCIPSLRVACRENFVGINSPPLITRRTVVGRDVFLKDDRTRGERQ